MGNLIIKKKSPAQTESAPTTIVVSPLMRETDAAAYLCKPPRFLTLDRHKAKQSGAKPEIPFVKIGGSIRYRRVDLEAYIEASVKGA